MKALFLCAPLLLISAAEARTYTCTRANGVTYSPIPCEDSNTVAESPPVPAARSQNMNRPVQIDQASSQKESNPYDRMLRAKIAGALADDDFAHAQALAVTEEHFAMIAAAKSRKQAADLETKRIKAESRPTRCVTFGYRAGNNYNSNIVCNK